ncbi:type I methionyl aminopeptidase [Hymenobacter sp. 15J16-1T3B]|uniref:type I methionyl aminopeptidase n=1 Tax=Hymenobacter sp. 15J16-1T3B TaxID=2886941 RepID=UPI001D125965|nr:type I methionyl aminopeptidase [Hymenobacter sp. 15J16-1T3B]MCC3158272.1 type I methionyl aminopeptidase [Hymenobacter sp. 15J16-1T3B]
MSITSEADLTGLQLISTAVASTLRQMREYAQPGMSTLELDEYGGRLLTALGARSAPRLTYGFPGWTCISVNQEVAHGIPSARKVLQEGDLINIDVSAEMGGYWADNGGSFVLGADLHNHRPLVEASRQILRTALSRIRGGVRIADIGGLIDAEARKAGFRVIKNLVGHGVGRSLHEEPSEIPCYYDRHNLKRFKKNSVVAVETFISTRASLAHQLNNDGWTLATKDGSFVAQHEHTVVVTDGQPLILTADNRIWD